MKNVLDVTIDPDIVLDPDRIKGMSEYLQGHLLATMTIACERYDCHWKELTWKVKFNNGQPYISVKPK